MWHYLRCLERESKTIFLNHPTLNKCIEAIEIQVILIKKGFVYRFYWWSYINGPNYTQSTDSAVYVPDIGIKISLKVFGKPICVYIGTCILCHKILVEETGIL